MQYWIDPMWVVLWTLVCVGLVAMLIGVERRRENPGTLADLLFRAGKITTLVTLLGGMFLLPQAPTAAVMYYIFIATGVTAFSIAAVISVPWVRRKIRQ